MCDLARLATRLASTHYTNSNGSGPIFDPCDFKAFRAAYVEAGYAPPFLVADEPGGVRFYVYGQAIALIGINGQVRLVDASPAHPSDEPYPPPPPAGLLPHILSPGNTAALGEHAHRCMLSALLRAYWRRTGKVLAYDDSLGGYFHSRVRTLTGMAVQAIRAFCARIQSDRLSALRHAQLASKQHAPMVELLTGPHGLEWQQAVRAYPALLNWSADPLPPARIVEAIESRLPLVPALAEHFRITPTEVRRFAGITPQRAGPFAGRDAVALIAMLPQQLRPVSKRDWRVAAGIAVTFPGWFPWCANGIPEDFIRSFFRGTKGPLSSLSPKYEAIPLHFGDVARTLSPAASADDAEAMARLQSMTVTQLCAFTDQWHRHMNRVTGAVRLEAVLQQSAAPPWPGVIRGKVISPVSDVLAVELTTAGELIDEGVELEHCVAGYVAACYEGASRILSLRCQLTGDRSTVELGQRSGVNGVRIVVRQHYGHENSAPSSNLERAVAPLIRLLNRERLEAWPSMPQYAPVGPQAEIHARMRSWMHVQLGLPDPLTGEPAAAKIDLQPAQ